MHVHHVWAMCMKVVTGSVSAEQADSQAPPYISSQVVIIGRQAAVAPFVCEKREEIQEVYDDAAASSTDCLSIASHLRRRRQSIAAYYDTFTYIAHFQ